MTHVDTNRCTRSRVGLKVAKAWGYVEHEFVSELDAKLDSIAARIFTLARR